MSKANDRTTVPLIPDARHVPDEFRQVFLEVVSLTDDFCKTHLNADYQQLCREMAAAICQPGSSVKRGKRASWSCGIVYSVGWVNFLTDRNQTPHLRAEEIAQGFGVSVATMRNKSKMIREALGLTQLDPDFMLPSRADTDPGTWLAEVDGVLVDLRQVPRELQAAAYQEGLIPFIPDDGGDASAPASRRGEPHPRPQPKAGLLMQFKVALRGIEPPVWRRIQIYDSTLHDLHEYIQAAFGWQNYHLHQFEIGGVQYGNPAVLGDGFDDFECVDSTRTLLSDILPETGRRFAFNYEYDFGDSWEHEVLFEGFPTPEKRKNYPLCLEGERACPPEDVGGPWGYIEYLEAISDPKHEEHEEFMQWRGPFDPEAFDDRKATRAMRKVCANPS